jgi:hypothetical protein
VPGDRLAGARAWSLLFSVTAFGSEPGPSPALEATVRRILLIIVLVLMGLGVVQAQRQTTSEQLTVSTSAVGITAAVIQPAGRAVPNNTCTVFVEGANIRFQWDGTAPTTTLGDIGYVGATIRIDNTEFMRSMRFIRDDAVNATLNIQCWLEPSS